MISRIPILSSIFGAFHADPHATDFEDQRARAAHAKDRAADMGRRWTKAVGRTPELRKDLIMLGGLFVLPPVNNIAGYPEPVTQDPYQCGREAGRRELATQLLALSGLTIDELNQLTEDDYADH